MMRESTKKAKDVLGRELKSRPLENLIDDIILKKTTENPSVLEREKYFEVPDKIAMFYKYSYGQQSRFFKELKDNATLYGTRCRKCGIVYFPPRAQCSECYSDTEWVPVSNEGIVVSGTTVWYTTSEFFDKTPYAVGYVRPRNASTAMLQRIDLKGRESVEPEETVIAVFKRERFGSVSDFWYEIKE